MAMSTKVEEVNSREYIKGVIQVNLSAIIIMSWFLISGLLSSYYCVLSTAQIINLCLVGDQRKPEETVPWHDFIRKRDEKSKPETVEQEIRFDAKETIESLKSTFLYMLKEDTAKHEQQNNIKKQYHHIAIIELESIITKLVEWDCKVISESHEFIKKIAPYGVILMTSFILLPMFLFMFFILNFFYTIFAWFNSIFGVFKQCGIVEYFDTVLHKKQGNVDPEALSVIGSLFFLFFYAIILPAISFITIIPILFYFFITLIVIPLYALFLPFKITGKLGMKNAHPEAKTAPFTLGTSMFSNIYTYMNYYSVVFSVIYALVASLLQDAYYFVGCLVAIALVWGATSFFKSEPYMDGGGASEEVDDNLSLLSDPSHEGLFEKKNDELNELNELNELQNQNGTVAPMPKKERTESTVNPSEDLTPEEQEDVQRLAESMNSSSISPNPTNVESQNPGNNEQVAALNPQLGQLGGSKKKHNKSKNKRNKF
jgi:hypothetical protein